MYNLEELHDPDKDYNGMKPYRNPYFSSIYQGMIVEIHVIDHCNLNCAGCNHFSPLSQPWTIEVENFKKQLEVLKENIPVVKELILLGGEPTLHPDLPLLCEIARNIFPKAHIVILSNGVKIDIVKDNAEIFKKLNIDINFCSYPGKTDFDSIKELNYPYFNTRNLLQQILVDKKGSKIQNNFLTVLIIDYHVLL